MIVRPSDSGVSLQAFLKGEMHHLSVRQIKRAIDRGGCRLNGQIERYGSTRVRTGDRVEFAYAEQQNPSVVYEDEAILAVNKPAGVVSTDLAKQMGHLAVHRLDRETSGLLLFAKNTAAKEALENLFRERKVTKRYLAVVDGVPKEEGGLLVKPINGKTAETRWELAKVGKQCSLFRCYPKTGRTHQIRIHLAGVGHPILGDGEYCRSFRSRHLPPRHLLHADRLIFSHPLTGETMRLSIPMHEDLACAF